MSGTVLRVPVRGPFKKMIELARCYYLVGCALTCLSSESNLAHILEAET